MIKLKQLEEDDLALAFILSDPILFGQFMRSTADGDMQNKASWEEFVYRHYQKDLMTDRNHFIVLTGIASYEDRNQRSGLYSPVGPLFRVGGKL